MLTHAVTAHKEARGLSARRYKERIKIMDRAARLQADVGMPEPDFPLRSELQRIHKPALTAVALGGTVVMIGLATGATAWLRAVIPYGSVALIFLVAVLLSAVLFGLWTGIIAAGLAFLAYNFFFVEPVLTFRVANAEDFLSLGVFVLVAGLTGTLAGRLREQAAAAQERARILEHLSRLSSKLGMVQSEEAAEQALLASLQHLTGASAVIVRSDYSVSPAKAVLGADDLQEAERALRRRSPQYGSASGWSGSSFSYYPLTGDPFGSMTVGVRPARHTPELDKAVSAAVEQFSAVIRRLRLAQDAESARLQVERERLRAALLSSLSHDLKTPLATILGSVTTLRQLANSLPEAAKDDLLLAIEEDARRLSIYVGNLLHMTWLQSGLDPSLDWVDPRDILNAAVARIRRSDPERQIKTAISGSRWLLNTDASLLEQALFNCLDNAARIAPQDTPITASLEEGSGRMVFSISDEGPGVPANEQARIFEPFQRGKQPTSGGTGLGLTIAKGIVQILGGKIGVESPLSNGRGARFWLSLPAESRASP